MIKIAICDDDEMFCHDLEQKLNKIFCREKWLIEIEIFFDGETMFQYMKHRNRYDLIFLDIELKKINGVTVGKAIRDRLQDENTQVVYISAKSISYINSTELDKIANVSEYIVEIQVKECIRTIDVVEVYQCDVLEEIKGNVNSTEKQQILNSDSDNSYIYTLASKSNSVLDVDKKSKICNLMKKSHN